MAIEAIQQLLSAPCGASSLATKQYYAVSYDSSGNIVLATAAANMDGILQDKPIVGQAGTICRDGVSKAAISASSNVVVGSLLEVDTGSTLKLRSAGTTVAKALETNSSAAYVTVLTVEILRSNASF